jgi:hypothetical protein
MKYSFTLLITLQTFITIAFSQNTKNEFFAKKQIFEVFTSATCLPCADVNPIIDNLLNNNQGNYSLIKYQVNWPGNGDDYYLSETNIRLNYYYINAAPTIHINGKFSSASHINQTAFDDSASLTTPLSIGVSGDITEEWDFTATVKLLSKENLGQGLKLHIMLVEKVTTGNVGTNGETEFHNVIMAYITPPQGLSLDSIVADNIVNIAKTKSVSNSNIEQAYDLRVIAFVQNDDDQSILQSEMTEVSHYYDIYTTKFIVKNEDNEPIDAAKIIIDDIIETDADGVAVFSSISQNYTYKITKPFYMTVNGDFYLSKDTIINITMSKIHDMLYEDFDNTDDNETPDGWINLSPEVNYKRFVYVKEHVLVFKQWLQNYDKSIFVSPEIDMSVAGILNFDLGEKYYHPQLEIGTMSNPDSANTFKKIIVIEPENGEMKHITVDLSDYPGFDKYLAFRMPETNLNAHFTLDNIKLQTDSNEGRYVATVIVRDEQNNPIKDATIAMGDSTHITDSNGVAYFIKLESGDYNFTVSSNYYSSNSGSIIIDDNNAETTILLQPLGVNDDLSSKVSVFPNPAKNIIIISSDKFINKINIYDITGRLLLKENQLMKNSTIDLSEFNRGILIINIKFEDNTAYNNVIIKQ